MNYELSTTTNHAVTIDTVVYKPPFHIFKVPTGCRIDLLKVIFKGTGELR